MNVNFAIEIRAENIFADEVLLARFLYRVLENPGAFRKFAANINVSRARIEREARDKDSLEKLVRIFVDNVAIFESSRLGFVGVADQINRLLFIGLDETPFHAAGKTGAAASAQTRRFDFVHDFGARHCNRFFQLLVAAVAHVSLYVDLPIFAADVLEDEPTFKRVRRMEERTRRL